ncbi:hypothetical protein P3T76_016052 [Phytophthora citrophthora]|uniref:Uncharacterized protein n=1 Tax=Phytophthora citrophthora TaxID=4793 RepID=A0AAD9FY78_9STRA|nr:hypothetical protein P3T76_016052 [Phytophthora citrophthora]
MDGGMNYKFLFSIQRKLLALILQMPGITETCVHSKMNKLLSLQDTREALSLLVEEGLVYARAISQSAAAKAKSLFETPSTHPSVVKVVKLVGNSLVYEARSRCLKLLFSSRECIQIRALKDYQNEAD